METGSHMTEYTTIQSPQAVRLCATLNGPFLRGFPAAHFLDFGVRGCSRIWGIFDALSPHPNIPFPAAWL